MRVVASAVAVLHLISTDQARLTQSRVEDFTLEAEDDRRHGERRGAVFLSCHERENAENAHVCVVRLRLGLLDSDGCATGSVASVYVSASDSVPASASASVPAIVPAQAYTRVSLSVQALPDEVRGLPEAPG